MRVWLLVGPLMGALAVAVTATEFVTDATADLNGDGKADTIKLTPQHVRGTGDFTLTVNGVSIKEDVGYGGAAGFRIVDIDENDKYREVAVHTDGPSDDPADMCFWYDGKKLRRTGPVMRGVPEFLGHGIVLARDWCSWGYTTEKYVLTAKHELKRVPQEFYWLGVEGTAQKSFPIYSARDGDRVQANVRRGSKVLLVLRAGQYDGKTGKPQWPLKTEHGQWLLKTEHGQLGWVREYPAPLLGLFMAD